MQPAPGCRCYTGDARSGTEKGSRPAMNETEWEIPLKLQPNPDDYAFDLERALRAVVGLRAQVPADGFTASTLGLGYLASAFLFCPRKAFS